MAQATGTLEVMEDREDMTREAADPAPPEVADDQADNDAPTKK